MHQNENKEENAKQNNTQLNDSSKMTLVEWHSKMTHNQVVLCRMTLNRMTQQWITLIRMTDRRMTISRNALITKFRTMSFIDQFLLFCIVSFCFMSFSRMSWRPREGQNFLLGAKRKNEKSKKITFLVFPLFPFFFFFFFLLHSHSAKLQLLFLVLVSVFWKLFSFVTWGGAKQAGLFFLEFFSACLIFACQVRSKKKVTPHDDTMCFGLGPRVNQKYYTSLEKIYQGWTF